MPKTHLNLHGQPLTAPKPPSWTRHRSSQPQPNAYITRTVLSNGYLAYRAELTTWFPEYKYIYRAPWLETLTSHNIDGSAYHWDHDTPHCEKESERGCSSRVKWAIKHIFLHHKLLTVDEGFPLNIPICWSRHCAAKKGYLRDVRVHKPTRSQIRKKEQDEKRAVEETVWWLKFDCRAVPEQMRNVLQLQDEEKERLKGGRLVQAGNVEVWRKEPRFRGSGRVLVLDDPVKDGRDLAFSEEVLPSDYWRDNSAWTTRADEGEGGDNISMDDIIRDEPAYTIKTVARCTRKRKMTTTTVVKKRVSFKTPLVEEIPYLQPQELLHPDSASDCGMSVGSDSGCEYDALLDFSKDEAQGWVPVMVREDHDEEEGWVSLTGSWMMLDGGQENKKMVKL